MTSDEFEKLANLARISIIKKCKEIGGVHIGGSFSSLDFLICFYTIVKSKLPNSKIKDFYHGKVKFGPQLIMSKGHCYIAQLAALDIVFDENNYLKQFFAKGSDFFGHPKRDRANYHFAVSSGSLGQGVAFGNGLALAEKLIDTTGSVVSVIGDGEMNEGVVFESINFAAQHKLPHWIVVDNNNQISLGKTSEILNIGAISKHCEAINFQYVSVNGHDFDLLFKELNNIFFSTEKNYKGGVLELQTIKGQGVSFMEGETRWHHRRFREGEFEAALRELEGKLLAK